MNSRERVLCVLSGGTPDRVPFCEASVDQGVAQQIAGVQRRLSELEISELLQRDILPLDATPPIFADSVTGTDGQLFYTRPWIQSEADLEKIAWPDPLDEWFCTAALDTIRNRGEYATVGMIRLGFSAAYTSMGFENFAYALADNPRFVQDVLRRFTEWTAVRIDFLQDIGFDILWAFDDIAFKSGPLVSPRVLREVLLPVIRPTVARIQVPWIYHSDGNLMAVLDDILDLGPSGLHPFEPGAMDIRAVKRRFGSRLCVLGNVGVDTLARGTPADVEDEVLGLLRDVAPLGGFALTTSNSIPPYAKAECVVAMLRALRRHGTYPIAL